MSAMELAHSPYLHNLIKRAELSKDFTLIISKAHRVELTVIAVVKKALENTLLIS